MTPRRHFKNSRNIVSVAELAAIIAAIPAKYRAPLRSAASLRSIKRTDKAARSMHPNSPIYALHEASENTVGRRITPSGLFHSRILHEIAGGLSWRGSASKSQQTISTFGATPCHASL